MILGCKIHGETEHSVRKDGRKDCRKCSVQRTSDFRRNRKRKLVELSGGKCVRCGYDKCLSALEFHHTDRSTKDFDFSSKGINRNWDLILAELKKCILVCSNCHAEIETEFYKNGTTTK